LMKSKLILYGFILLCSSFITGCRCGCGTAPKPDVLSGKWKWVKTTTPTRTLTPGSEGYTKTLDLTMDYRANVISINDSLEKEIFYIATLEEEVVDGVLKSRLVQYYNQIYIKYYFKPEHHNGRPVIELSEMMKSYDPAADTVRHHYEFAEEW